MTAIVCRSRVPPTGPADRVLARNPTTPAGPETNFRTLQLDRKPIRGPARLIFCARESVPDLATRSGTIARRLRSVVDLTGGKAEIPARR